METRLIPLKHNYTYRDGRVSSGFEQIVLEYDGIPAALFHVDLLWNTPEHKAIYERLCAGETVEVEIFVKAVEQ